MTPWILILMISAGPNLPVTILNIDYGSMRSCIAAGTTAIKQLSGAGREIKFACTPKYEF